jgi:hypothetical protein
MFHISDKNVAAPSFQTQAPSHLSHTKEKPKANQTTGPANIKDWGGTDYPDLMRGGAI